MLYFIIVVFNLTLKYILTLLLQYHCLRIYNILATGSANGNQIMSTSSSTICVSQSISPNGYTTAFQFNVLYFACC